MPGPGAAPARQRGWAAALTLLLTVLLVTLLAGTLLKQSGGPAAPGAAGPPDPNAAGATPPSGSAALVEPQGGTRAPGNAVDRARAVEESVKQQAADLEKRIDDATK